LVLFYFPNRELLRRDLLLSAVRELETIFLGGEAMRRFLISNFRRVLNAVFFLLGDSPASEFYIPTLRNTLFHLHRHSTRTYLPMKIEQSVPKRRNIKFRRRGITQKKAYSDGKMFHSRDVRCTWGLSHVFCELNSLCRSLQY